MARNLERVANKFDIQVVLSAPDKFKRLCLKINSQKESADQCTVQRANEYVICSVGVNRFRAVGGAVWRRTLVSPMRG